MNSLEQSFAHCEQLAKNHYENFPVGSFLVPKNKRKYVWAVYAFARTADDFADEGRHGNETPEELKIRLDQLDAWERKLDLALEGKAEDPIFIAVAQTLQDLQIPHQLLRDLLTAYRMDVQQRRYETFEDLQTYCRYSANPVGRLVLYIFGYRDPQLMQWSDSICTALQLANFWQDIRVDLEKDRVYIPQAAMRSHGFSDDRLQAFAAGLPCDQDEKFQSVMQECFVRTREFFNNGLPLCDAVEKRLRWELRLTWLGGASILTRTAQARFDVFRHRPALSGFDKLKLLVHALCGVPIRPLL